MQTLFNNYTSESPKTDSWQAFGILRSGNILKHDFCFWGHKHNKQ